jgi:hypothetical protein
VKPSQSETAFRKRLGGPIEGVTPRRVLEAMFAFYAEQRAEDVDIDEDGDMLLYEWGVYRFTGPESFQIGIVRQFCVIDEDEPYQLHMTLLFAPPDAYRQLEDGNKWCHSPEELPAFREFVESSAAFKAVADTNPSRVELYFEQC